MDAVVRKIKVVCGAKRLDLRKPFRRFDRSGGGTLSKAEFQSAMRDLGLKLGAQEIAALVDHLDKDGDGNIDYAEFLSAFLNKKKMVRMWTMQRAKFGGGGGGSRLGLGASATADGLVKLFHRFDPERSGKLSRHDFKRAARHLGFMLPDWQIEAVCDRFSEAGFDSDDRRVDYAAFAEFLHEDDALADTRTGKKVDARGEDTGFRAPWNRSGTYGSLRRTNLTLDPETRPRTRARQGGYGGTARF